MGDRFSRFIRAVKEPLLRHYPVLGQGWMAILVVAVVSAGSAVGLAALGVIGTEATKHVIGQSDAEVEERSTKPAEETGEADTPRAADEREEVADAMSAAVLTIADISPGEESPDLLEPSRSLDQSGTEFRTVDAGWWQYGKSFFGDQIAYSQCFRLSDSSERGRELRRIFGQESADSVTGFELVDRMRSAGAVDDGPDPVTFSVDVRNSTTSPVLLNRVEGELLALFVYADAGDGEAASGDYRAAPLLSSARAPLGSRLYTEGSASRRVNPPLVIPPEGFARISVEVPLNSSDPNLFVQAAIVSLIVRGAEGEMGRSAPFCVALPNLPADDVTYDDVAVEAVL